MLQTIISFLNLLAVSLTAGAMFGVWLGMNPSELAPHDYVVQQQHFIKGLNVPMPILGGVSILLTAASAVLARASRSQLTLLLIGAACFIVAGVITRTLNQPINAVMIHWLPGAPPSNWMQLRDSWWRWHVVRTCAAVTGLGFVIAAKAN